MMRTAVLAFSLAVFLFASQAQAAWNVEPEKSHITFTAKQGNDTINGSFKLFKITVDFDPTHPELGKITATIDLSSATAGNSERDAYLSQPDWFDALKFPNAEFATSEIHAAGGPSCYEATGNLTIKGVGKTVTLPFCLTTQGKEIRAQGQTTILRNDYGVGSGQWASEGVVANAVTVGVDILAR